MSAPWILVVEDDDDIRETLLDLLQGQGHEALGARDGRQAIDTLRGRMDRPCLVLLDLLMPRLDGYELLGLLGHDIECGRLKVVVMTAGIPSVDRLPNVQILRKPLDAARLLELVDLHCAA